MRDSIFIAAVVALTTLLWPHDAQANYIDPSTGGVLRQVIFGGLAGVAVIWKLFRLRIAMMFSPRRLMRRLLRLPSEEIEISDAESSDRGGT